MVLKLVFVVIQFVVAEINRHKSGVIQHERFKLLSVLCSAYLVVSNRELNEAGTLSYSGHQLPEVGVQLIV